MIGDLKEYWVFNNVQYVAYVSEFDVENEVRCMKNPSAQGFS